MRTCTMSTPVVAFVVIVVACLMFFTLPNETVLGARPQNLDTDGDGVPDDTDSDDDNDGMTDTYEQNVTGTNPKLTDSDGDQLSDDDEVIGVPTATGITPTDPGNDDSDGDGWTDGEEVIRGSDPLDDGSRPDNTQT